MMEALREVALAIASGISIQSRPPTSRKTERPEVARAQPRWRGLRRRVYPESSWLARMGSLPERVIMVWIIFSCKLPCIATYSWR